MPNTHLHALLGISDQHNLVHPQGRRLRGRVIPWRRCSVRPDEAYYWATHNGAELDLLLPKKDGIGISASAPTRLC